MKIEIIGSGNAFNTNGRAHAAYLIESNEGSCILLDCGATTLYRLQQNRFDLNRLDCILLTHFHGDHFGGLPFLLIQMWIVDKRNRPLKIIGPEGVKKRCSALIEICYPDFIDKCDIEFIEIFSSDTYDLLYRNSDLSVMAFDITHRPESLGYRLKDMNGVLAFCGDSAFDKYLFDLVDTVDLALIELSIFSQEKKTVDHVSLEEIKMNFNRLNARKIIFTHIYNELAQEAETLGYKTAFDGMIIKI